MEMNFIPSKDSDGKRLMHSKSDNEDIMTSFDTEESIEELFKSLLHRQEVGLEQLIKGNWFVFNYVDGLHYKCHKISLSCGGSYLDFPKLLKNKKNVNKSKK